MSGFSNSVWFEVEHCCNCGVAFAMNSTYQRARREKRDTFYCPSGHPQHYTGKSEADKLKEEVARKQELLDSANARAARAQSERDAITKAHSKMRTRVMNGVCPCCNRTFQNLMMHMKSEHPDYASTKTLYALRTAFGMTQWAVASEAGVDSMHVSLYERDKPVAPYAKRALDAWVQRQGARKDVATEQQGSRHAE